VLQIRKHPLKRKFTVIPNHASINNPHARYWKKVRSLTLALLVLWVSINFSVIFFARELAGLMLFGWPVSFYMAAQGTLLIYLLIIGGYALSVNRLEQHMLRTDTLKAPDESN
jgi:putative solute:sodium symporter small subunit